MARKVNKQTHTAAFELLRDPDFLYRANPKLGETGVIEGIEELDGALANGTYKFEENEPNK